MAVMINNMAGTRANTLKRAPSVAPIAVITISRMVICRPPFIKGPTRPSSTCSLGQSPCLRVIRDCGKKRAPLHNNSGYTFVLKESQFRLCPGSGLTDFWTPLDWKIPVLGREDGAEDEESRFSEPTDRLCEAATPVRGRERQAQGSWSSISPLTASGWNLTFGADV
jgi:hypothetical protein